jgi:hypothetical protein
VSTVVGRLGAWECVRLTTHPLVGLGVAISVLWVLAPALRESPQLSSAPGTPYNVYLGLVTLPSFLLGPLTLFAANLLASRDSRAGTAELLAGAPTTARTRTLGLLLAPVGPAALAALIAVAQVAAFRAAGVVPSRWPTVAELAVHPAMVLGGGVLGVAVARRLPVPGAAAITMVLLVGTYPVGAALGRDTWLSFAPLMDLATSDDRGRHVTYFPGSVAWHVAYLLCLAALAAIAALQGTPGPRRALLAAGLVALSAAAGAGWAQLP